MSIAKGTTDVDAIAWVRSQGLPEKERRDLWGSRYCSSKELRDEFPKEEEYVAFMEACLRGSVRIFSGRR